MKFKKIAQVCSRRWDVEVKFWFSTLGSAMMTGGGGFRTQYMVFHGSFGFLEDKAFLWMERFALLVSVLISFRTSRYLFQTQARF